ncbi:MAG TPA: hypothetical protein VGD46_13465 [Rhizobacter sp.]
MKLALIVILAAVGLTGCATMSTYAGTPAQEAAAADAASARVAADLADCNPYTPGPIARAVDGALIGTGIAALTGVGGSTAAVSIATLSIVGATAGAQAQQRAATYTDAGACMARKGYTVTQG